MWGSNWFIFMHGWFFFSVCLIRLDIIRWISFHFEKKTRMSESECGVLMTESWPVAIHCCRYLDSFTQRCATITGLDMRQNGMKKNQSKGVTSCQKCKTEKLLKVFITGLGFKFDVFKVCPVCLISENKAPSTTTKIQSGIRFVPRFYRNLISFRYCNVFKPDYWC